MGKTLQKNRVEQNGLVQRILLVLTLCFITFLAGFQAHAQATLPTTAAALPFSYGGVWVSPVALPAYIKTYGISQIGTSSSNPQNLGSSASGGIAVFDNNSAAPEEIIIRLTRPAFNLSYYLTYQNGTEIGAFEVFQSQEGTTWQRVRKFGDQSGDTPVPFDPNGTKFQDFLAPTTAFVKFKYTTKTGGTFIYLDDIRVTGGPDIDITAASSPVPTGSTYTFAAPASPVSFGIKNLGVDELKLTSTPHVVVSGPDAEAFSITQPATANLPTNTTTSFTVTFSPTSYGLKSAVLTIASNDPDESAYIINLAGDGGTPPPQIISFKDLNENEITVAKIGDKIFIDGADFTSNQLEVTFAGSTGPIPAAATFISAQRIQVTVPVGAVAGEVTVKTAGGTASRSLSIIPPPVVSGLFDAAENGTAKTAGKVGDEVYIYGAEFIQQGLTVTFAGATGPVNAAAELVSPTVIKTIVPEDAQTGPIQVATAGGSASSETFTVIPRPQMTAFKDSDGNTIVGGKIGTVIFIEGTAFTQQDLNVTFTTAAGTIQASPTFINDQRIQVTIPNEAITGLVTVTAEGGNASRSFMIFFPPVVSGLFDAAVNGTAKTRGKVGDEVYIYGAEFIEQGLTVTFAGSTTPAYAELVNPTVIKTIVPEDAQTGPIQVATAGGSASSETFTVYLKPTITAFTDYDLTEIIGGKAGDEIYIQGTDFTPEELKVTFSNNTGGTIQAEATWVSEQYILTEVPDGAATGDVMVTAAGGTATRSFKIFPAPQVSGLFDAQVDGNVKTEGKIDEAVYIYGRDFTQTAFSVSFTGANGLVPALAEYLNDNVVRAFVPNEAQTGPIRVTAAGGFADSEPFTVLHQPTITAFKNLNQTEIIGGKGGDEIIIEGTYFTERELNVTFITAAGPISAQATRMSEQQIRATVPADAITGEVTVTAAGGTAARTFTIFPVPVVSGLYDAAENGTAKTTGKVGEAVYIYGAEFVQQGLTVAFAGENGPVDATAELLGPTVIRTVVPVEAVTGPILVTTAGGSASSEEFTVIPLPAINGFLDLALNAINGSKPGQEIFIEGRNFSGTPPDVTFTTAAGPVTAEASLVSAQRIRVRVPAEAITGDVTITAPGGTAIRVFTVFQPPVVSGLYDAAENGTAKTAGKIDDEVYIYGTNFVPDNLMVEYTGADSTLVAAAAEFISASVIRTVVPAGAVTGPIQLTTAGGAATSGSFTVYPPPAILAFADFDLNEITGGKVGDEIYIRGTNFSEDPLAVTFTGAAGPIAVAAPQWFSEEYILVQVPEGAKTGGVTVTAAGGTATRSFTIFPAPQITGLFDAQVDGNPKNSGKAGDVVYIRGTHFTLNGLSVSFTDENGFVAALTEFIDSTVIKVIVPNEAQTGPVRVTSAGGLALSETFNLLGNTYTWNGTSSQWSAADNWTPARNTHLRTDELVFDGNQTPTPTVVLDLEGAQTIGQLKFINGVAATFTVDANQTLTLNGGVTGTDFLLDATSSLTLTNSIEGAGLTLNISSGETGVVAGAITLQGEAATAPHQFTANSTNGLIFQSGSTFTTGTNFTGNPFGTASAGSVNFANGSVYRNQTGNSPFGGTAAVVKFEPASTYYHLQNTAPDLANRVYGNFVVDVAGFEQEVKGTGTLHVTNLTMANTGTFNVGLVGTININGDIQVNTGSTLTFNPDASSNYNMVGVGATQSVSGEGAFILGANAIFNISESSTVTLAKNIVGDGQVGILGTVITDNANGLLGTDAAIQSPVTIHVVGAGSTVVYNGTGSQLISQLPQAMSYANLTIAGNRNNETVTLPAGTDLKISGQFTPSATDVVYSPNSTIEFNGGAAQTIPVFPYHNLTLLGAGTKTLAGNTTALGEVLINNSLLETGDNILELGPAAALQEVGSGYLRGQVGVTRAVTNGATQSFAGIGVSMTPADGSAAPGDTRILRDTRTAVSASPDTGGKGSITRVYHIHNSTPGIEVTMTLAYDERELQANGLDEITGLRMYRQNAEDLWEEQIESNFNAEANTVTLAGVTAFSPWTLAGPNEVLPVEVTAFTAKRRHDLVELAWTTAMEDNNQGFEVEVSTDARYYEKVGFVASKNPNSRTAITYTFTDDKTLATGTRYYRLKQVDLDGTAAYYGPKAVKIESMVTAASVYPNPFNDVFTVKYVAETSHSLTLTVLDALGKKVSEQVVPVTPGMNYLQVQVGNQHPKGLYLLHVSGHGNPQTFRMIKK